MNIHEKYLKENSLGKAGVERVRKYLHKMVDLYIDGDKNDDGLMPESDYANDDFYVRDFYKWHENRD